MSESAILEAYEAATKFAYRVAKGRLDDDDCRSEAGLAVALVLRRGFDPNGAATFLTAVCAKVRGLVLNLIEKNSRYEHRDEAYWGALLAPTYPPHDELREIEETVASGASVRQIQNQFGMSYHEALTFNRRYRNAGKKAA